jgi:hypothetical protein
MEIKIFSRGFCRDNKKETIFTRHGLRKHLRTHVRNELFNHIPRQPNGQAEASGHAHLTKQPWVIERIC